MALVLTLLQSLILGVLGVHSSYPRFSSNDSVFQHLALHPDPSIGTVYVGARDHLFQLAGLDGLRLVVDERTGPVRDSKDCLPPVTLENCPQAGLVNNHNKLLLVDPYYLQLITCGSVHQGTCQKRSLAKVNEVLFSAERPVDTQYVAANDPMVSTVGLVVRPQDKDPVLYVGRGYTSSHPPVSTRQLSTEPVFSYEETAKLAVAGRLSEYDHNFVATFARRNHVYFLFYRRDLKAASREYRTYVARVCLDDQAYYSYVEVPLVCHSNSTGRNYSLLQGAQVGGEESGGSQVLMGVFSTGVSAANGPSEESALCVYSLDEVDRSIDATRDLCYTQYGVKDGNKLAYIEYDVKSNCAYLPTNTLKAYPCGSDHTPSPMASREPVKVEAVLNSSSARLTAVAVSVKEGHTIVFLGDSKGNLHKVFLGNSGEVKKYSTLLIQPGLAINSDLLLDSTHRHIYIMTSHSVEKRPVAECDKHTDCTSCLAVKDPYCGWCVLDGRCGMRSDCRLGSVEGHWLWSFDEQQQQCLRVESMSQYNASLGEQKQIAVGVPGLPSLSEGDMYSCFFEDTETSALVQGTTVTCATPEAHRLPPLPQGEDSVSVTLSLRFRTVTIALADFTFYDCSVVQQLSGTRPCRGCVNSRWKCNWCIHQHVCTHRSMCDRGAIIYNQHESLLVSRGSDACPCVEGIQSSSLLPVNVERKITLLGRNLHLYQDKDLDYQCVLVIEGRSEYRSMISVRRRDSFQMDYPEDLHGTLPAVCPGFACAVLCLCHVCFVFAVRLYNCSVGRSDCSRCHTADQQYECVWCEGSRSSCVYRSSCTEHVQQTCPAPHIHTIEPLSGPVEGGTVLTVSGSNLGQRAEDIQHSVTVAGVPCTVIPDRYEVSSSVCVYSSSEQYNERVECVTGGSNRTGESGVTVRFGGAQRHLQEVLYQYTPDPNVTHAAPSKSFIRRARRIVPEPNCPEDSLCVVKQVEFTQVSLCLCFLTALNKLSSIHLSVIVTQLVSLCLVPDQLEERCTVNSSTLILCPTPEVGPEALRAAVSVHFLLDNLHFEFEAVSGSPFSYEPNPVLHSLNQHDPSKPFRHKPGSIISVEGENLDLAMSKDEVVALIGDGECAVKTLTRNHLYCEPPTQQPSVTVRMGNMNFSLGRVQYDSQGPAAFPLEAQVGVGVGASIVALIVLVIVLIYRRKSKQALRDYKKVQIQLENLETSVRDRCKKEFTDLMTEMMDVSSDLMGSGIPVLDYRKYSERIFFPGHRDSPLRRDLDVPAGRRATVEQGLVQLSNLLNSKLFLTKFIHTLEAQRTFSPRDRAYVASLLTVALHGKLEYFTDILKTLLSHLVEQYTTKNPKLMLRRTESVVEKLLTNWMSICLYTFLRDTAGEAFYMLFRAIKHQVDKGPVDAVTGKAKYTLNDNRLLREDVEYRTLTLNVLVSSGGAGESQTVPTKVLDCDTITQVKEKIVEQTWKGTSYSQRPSADSVHLEWRAGMAGHLILSDQDLTSVVQGSWKRLNTLQHYKVPDGATVTLVSRQSKQIHHDSHDYIPGEKTPMLEDGDEGGVKQWHLVKANEEAELPKHRRGSLRDKERERAKAIPEMYLTRLLSVKGTLQKFVDDLFTVILSTSRPVPLAVKYFFDLLDDQAAQHNITDPETIHIWKTNSLPLRFWINILKNPQFIFDVQASDNVDAVLSVIAQTFMDSCTIADHKLGRDSPINKLLYARDIPRYKQMVERYYSDIRQTIPVSDQEMNSSLAELSRNYSNEVNHLVALHELYKYINKYYDQIITALEEDSTAQKMQLGYRLQQIAAAVENKVTDL
uniref:Plexin-B1 n=1 Tax=Cyprinus carpio TaxID=7962 RepID=A0A8C1MBL4_CYPCA